MDAMTSYTNLGPDDILNALDQIGYHCDGRILALNSYENRVYQVGIEDAAPVIAKFYRPGRWSDECILEEHAFTLALAEQELPVIAPLIGAGGKSLFHTGPFRFAVYPRVGGHAPELDNPEQLTQLGRCLARLHNIGAVEPFHHRRTLDMQTLAVAPHAFLLEHGFIPTDILPAYETLTEDLLGQIRACFDRAGDYRSIRLHGDCHLGNVLWNNGPFLVDFDDACMGPAVQDLWMFLSGDRAYMTAGLHNLLEGYTEFRDFSPAELNLVEALRSLRMIHYAGWLAMRWEDPAFPRAFPWFNTQRYWQDHVLALREQAALMQEPPLQWQPD
ncbi:MAG: serine/threonine protein kinase [Gammaproteobacteria bacterium]|jgi:Ser/Thr protein kinase RdoA (MazF antagonist)